MTIGDDGDSLSFTVQGNKGRAADTVIFNGVEEFLEPLIGAEVSQVNTVAALRSSQVIETVFAFSPDSNNFTVRTFN